MEGSKFRKLAKITRVGSYHGYSKTRCAHGNQSVIGQSTPSYLLVIVLRTKTSEDFSGLSPVPQIGDQNPPRLFEITLETFHNVPIARACASIEFLKHY